MFIIVFFSFLLIGIACYIAAIITKLPISLLNNSYINVLLTFQRANKNHLALYRTMRDISISISITQLNQ